MRLPPSDMRKAWDGFIANLAFISLFGVPVKYVFFRDSDLPDAVITCLWAIFVLGATTLVVQIIRARERIFPYFYPGPSWLWKIIYFRLPVPFGISYEVRQRLQVVIIVDHAHRAILETAVAGQYNDESLTFRWIEIGEDPEAEAEARLQHGLTDASAVLVGWSARFARYPRILELLEEWATNQTFRPVLAIAFDPPDPTQLRFPTVSRESSAKAVWLLFSRAIERAVSWHDQAGLYRRVWAWTAGLAGLLLVATIVLGNATWENSRKLRAHVQRYSDVVYCLNVLRGDIGRMADSSEVSVLHATSEDVRATLGQYAEHIRRQLEGAYRFVPTEEAHVSFWRRMVIPDSNGTLTPVIVQVGWSGARTPVVFREDYNSIIGSAFMERAFVMWRQPPRAGRTAAWNAERVPIGTWNKSGDIEFTTVHANQRAVGRYGKLIEDRQRSGLYAFATGRADGQVQSGVLIDTHDSPERLRDAWVGDVMARAAALLQTVPDTLLHSREVDAAIARFQGRRLRP